MDINVLLTPLALGAGSVRRLGSRTRLRDRGREEAKDNSVLSLEDGEVVRGKRPDEEDGQFHFARPTGLSLLLAKGLMLMYF